MNTLTHTSFYNITCKICSAIRKALFTAFVAVVAFGESAGRARAAAELARMGHMDAAKSLILREDEKND